MDFEIRPISSCPVWAIVAIPDITGAFIVAEHTPSYVRLLPMRGTHDNFICRNANRGLISVNLRNDTEVELIWIGNASINMDPLFEDMVQQF